MKKKTIALVLACILCVGIGVAGTLAWLTDTTDAVTNTFTTSDINVELAETKGGENKEFKMIPGYTIEKDPKATVKAGSEKCYLFVKLDKSANFDKFMTYTMATGWQQLKNASDADVTGVYYQVVDASTVDQEFDVIADNTVTVKNSVTKADMNTLNDETRPTLTVTAYASQFMKNNTQNFSPIEAWDNISNPTGATT